MMTDADLAKYLHLSPSDAAIVIPKLSDGRRRAYDRMQQIEIQAALWMEGLGPKPQGALIDTDRSVKKRKGWG